ncbi:hypothetical protein OQA88_5302 [Cercophora sp. LCS_1]
MPYTKLTSIDAFFEPCPTFRVLVLGNPESTKQELFSKIFGVDLEKVGSSSAGKEEQTILTSKKLVADGFDASHDITAPLDLEGQNERLAIYTSPNFGTNNEDEAVYERVCGFIAERTADAVPLQERIHCIWYCVASEEERPVSGLERRFFGGELHAVAPHVPVILVFTKYDDFVAKVQLDWSKDAQERGLSKVAVTHILRDLTAKRFEKTIQKRWDEVLLDAKGRPKVKEIQRVCVAGGDDPDGDDSSFEELAKATLEVLKEWHDWHVKLAFAAAQRNCASISTRFCADAAMEYYGVDTDHVRKVHGIDMRDIMPNFFMKAVKIFNMRDRLSVLMTPNLLERALGASFDTDQRPLLDESLHHSSTEPGILLGLSPHERAVLLTQALASVVMFLDRLADTQWPHRDPFPATLTKQAVDNEIRGISADHGKRGLMETVENSGIFASCPLKHAISDLIVRSVEQADKISSPHGRGAGRALVVMDDSELQEMSLSFVNDKGPNDMVLPCGLTILPLN